MRHLGGEGDWNCDGDFTTRDLVTAFSAGGYVREARPAIGRVAAEAVARRLDGETASFEGRGEFAKLVPVLPGFSSKLAERPVAIDEIFRDSVFVS